MDVSKYRLAGKNTVNILDEVVKRIIVGANVKDICKYGDSINKNICFPTTISVNNIVSNFTEDYILRDGDLVKIELGSHINNYPTMVCYTMVCGETITRDQYNIMKALSVSSKKILKLMTPDHNNLEVIEVLNKVASKYNCCLPYVNDLNVLDVAPGVSSYQMSKDVLVGLNDDQEDEMDIHKQILHRYKDHYPYNMCETFFEANEVYSIDIVMCLGEDGLLHPGNSNIYGKIPKAEKYELRLNASRLAYKQTKTFPINCNNLSNVNKYKIGIKECVNHGLVNSYPVFSQKTLSGRVKFTVIVTDEEPILITGRSIESLNKKIV